MCVRVHKDLRGSPYLKINQERLFSFVRLSANNHTIQLLYVLVASNESNTIAWLINSHRNMFIWHEHISLSLSLSLCTRIYNMIDIHRSFATDKIILHSSSKESSSIFFILSWFHTTATPPNPFLFRSIRSPSIFICTRNTFLRLRLLILLPRHLLLNYFTHHLTLYESP